MMVVIHREVQKYLLRLSVRAPGDKERCLEALKELGEDPRHSRSGVDIEK